MIKYLLIIMLFAMITMTGCYTCSENCWTPCHWYTFCRVVGVDHPLDNKQVAWKDLPIPSTTPLPYNSPCEDDTDCAPGEACIDNVCQEMGE